MLNKLRSLFRSPDNTEKLQNKETSSQKRLNVEETQQELVERVPITGTPLTSTMNDGKYYLTMGKYRVNMDTFNSHEEVMTYVEQNEMTVMVNLMLIIYHDCKQKDEQARKEKYLKATKQHG